MKIDSNGVLYIERGSKFIKQKCPLASHMTNCCDMCPMFFEYKNFNKKCTEIQLLCINNNDANIFKVTDERTY
jgi:hypothetical protein